MRTMISGVLILILWGAVPALAQLPPEIQADFYLLRAEQAIDESDTARAMVELDKIILLQKEHELDLPDEFHFRHAQAAAAADLAEQALEAVEKYLLAAGREGRHYVEALELMSQAQDAIEANKEPQEASNEPVPEPAQVAKQGPIEDQLDTDGNPGAHEDKGTLITAGASTEAQPAPDCGHWNTEYFFRTATLANVTACLAAGADPMARHKYKGNTPLHFAARYSKNPVVIEALLKAGADPKARDEDQETPLLHGAAWNKNPAVVQVLLAAGADVQARDEDQETPLHGAAWNKNPAVVQVLLAGGADPMARDEDQETPLHLAAYNENPAAVQALLAGGADPNARDEDQETPLHWAAHNKNPAVVQALLAAGANRKAKNKFRETPLDEAEDAGNITAIEVLRHPKRAAARKTRTKKRGGGLGAFIAGTALAATASAAGASTEDAVALGSSVITGQQPAGNSGAGFDPDVLGPTGSTGGTAGGGSCLIPGYPRPPGGVANLGFSWCAASVGMQARAFALQAAGAQCAIATGSSSTPEQIQARRREIAAACERLAALGVSNCRCPAGLGGPGYSEDASSIDREQERREQQAKQQEEARQAAQRERQARQEAEASQAAERRRNEINRSNAEILNSNCSCISIKDDGRYACMDGFVVGKDSSGKPLCDISR